MTANNVYQSNFGIKPDTLSLEYLKCDYYDRLCRKKGLNPIVAWFMSPPCQPFSCQGNGLDLKDNRTDAFKNLVNLINSKEPDFILLENVKNFEVSIIV